MRGWDVAYRVTVVALLGLITWAIYDMDAGFYLRHILREIEGLRR